MSGPGDGGPLSVAVADQDGFPGCESARAVAEAVLYEGYLLYPYRRSSGKNRVRWQFGVLAPRDWIEARPAARASVAGSADTWRQRTECLVEARSSARLRVRVRFLQAQHRSVQLRAVQPSTPRARSGEGRTNEPPGRFVPVDALEVDGERHLTFEEAVPREFDVTVSPAALAGEDHVELITIPGAEDIQALGEHARVVRQRWPVSVRVRLSIADASAPFPLRRLRVDVENAVTGVPDDAPRAEVLRRCLVSTHCLLSLRDGVFLSLLDPPAWASAAAKECVNLHTFPVLAGEDGGRDVMLSSPIIMYDHPGIAPESPGDLFDACEIDEILTLRTLTLTDDEKAEARATDPRARAIVDRADLIPDEMFARLHGAVRSLRPVSDDEPPATPVPTPVPTPIPPPALPPAAVPWWDPGAEASVSPGSDSVVVDGIRVARGSRVRLHPRVAGTDAHDMFLHGRIARVEAVLHDIDGSLHVAVVLEDDPGADLHRWYGRYHYFGPDELSPVGDLNAVEGNSE
ncbi:MAG TPA: hypothetical protein VL595_35465 [Pseudonocardia sp.]|nr:hypothetical protein [Pseudonocardia sp.]